MWSVALKAISGWLSPLQMRRKRKGQRKREKSSEKEGMNRVRMLQVLQRTRLPQVNVLCVTHTFVFVIDHYEALFILSFDVLLSLFHICPKEFLTRERE